MTPKPIRCDIFCTVIDNFGDAAVCWRLARQLSSEYDWSVRLLIDQPEVLSRLVPDKEFGTVEIIEWSLSTVEHIAATMDISDVVIEAFACNVPDAYVAAMARATHRIAWLNLEYLSAESWVEGAHLRPSRHPQLGLDKSFFFPGFNTHTGGLLRERDYEQRKAAFQPEQLRRDLGLPGQTDVSHPSTPLRVSLFSYPNPQLPTLIEAWALSERPIQVLLPGSEQGLQQIGAVSLIPIPFLSQRRYDELLWLCDVNFVRGEDSFVRAQLAGKPLVWHIYPQDDMAHQPKLDAFLTAYPDSAAMRPLWHAWNGASEPPNATTIVPAWQAYQAALPQLSAAALAWKQALLAQTDLAAQLVKACLARIE